MIAKAKHGRITLGSFDLIKGIGILLVILFHTFTHLDWEQSSGILLIKKLVDATKYGLMPMFFLISGFGFKEKSSKIMLKKTFSDLIIPYLWVMLAYAVICPLAYCLPAYNGSWELAIQRAAKYVVAFLFGFSPHGTVIFGYETAWCTAAWYFLATFVAFNVLNQIIKIKNIAVQSCCVILCAIVGGVLFHFNFVFYCIPQGLMAVGYCYVGYVLKKYNLFERILSSAWTYIILIPIYLIERKWGYYDLSQGLFNNMFLDYIGAGCSGALFMFIGVYLGKSEWKGLDWVKQLGMYTYWIFSIHAIEMETLPWWYWERPFAENQLLALIIELVLKAILITTVCILMKKITKYKYLKMRTRNKK